LIMAKLFRRGNFEKLYRVRWRDCVSCQVVGSGEGGAAGRPEEGLLNMWITIGEKKRYFEREKESGRKSENVRTERKKKEALLWGAADNRRAVEI